MCWWVSQPDWSKHKIVSSLFAYLLFNLGHGQLGTFNVNETLQDCMELLLTCRWNWSPRVLTFKENSGLSYLGMLPQQQYVFTVIYRLTWSHWHFMPGLHTFSITLPWDSISLTSLIFSHLRPLFFFRHWQRATSFCSTFSNSFESKIYGGG